MIIDLKENSEVLKTYKDYRSYYSKIEDFKLKKVNLKIYWIRKLKINDIYVIQFGGFMTNKKYIDDELIWDDIFDTRYWIFLDFIDEEFLLNFEKILFENINKTINIKCYISDMRVRSIRSIYIFDPNYLIDKIKKKYKKNYSKQFLTLLKERVINHNEINDLERVIDVRDNMTSIRLSECYIKIIGTNVILISLKDFSYYFEGYFDFHYNDFNLEIGKTYKTYIFYCHSNVENKMVIYLYGLIIIKEEFIPFAEKNLFKYFKKEYVIEKCPEIYLRLNNGITEIYIDGNRFNQCKYVLMNIPREYDNYSYEEIDSIDEFIEKFSVPENEYKKIRINCETEFFVHCSNIEAWVENGFDTRILDSKLSFPLLKELYILNIEKAKIRFKEEIVKRFSSGNKNTILFLIEKGYLNYLDNKELIFLFKEMNLKLELEKLNDKSLIKIIETLAKVKLNIVKKRIIKN